MWFGAIRWLGRVTLTSCPSYDTLCQVGHNEEERPDEPKGFIEEAFEHRQRSPRGSDPGDVLAGPESDDFLPPDDIPIEDEDIEDVDLPAADEALDPILPPAPEPLEASDQALVDEALKKSALIWVQTLDAPAGQAVWHSWLDGAIYLVTGGDEQPDPGLHGLDLAAVLVRSKETTSRLVTVAATVEPLTPEAPDWAAAVADLAKSRLNLHDAENVAIRWADGAVYRLYRLRPVRPLLERPGRYPTTSHRAPPVPTPATTAGPKPKILHRRHGSGSPLS
jgi:hypothetical protein